MMEGSVTLIIKAANQSVPDHHMDCDSDWTVLRVKDLLSSTHPSKPRVDEQRLIYSGQLLLDDLKLRSVLRHPTENNSYTVHLVCSPPRTSAPSASTQKPLSTVSSSSLTGSNSTPQLSPLRTPATGESNMTVPGNEATTTPSSSPPSTSNDFSVTNETTDGLRRRITTATREETLGATQQGIEAGYPTQAQVSMGVFQATADPIQQMATMQQMYANYMAYVQYMQMGGMGTLPWPQQMFHHVPTASETPSSSANASSPSAAAAATEPVEQQPQQQPLAGDQNGVGAANQPQQQPQIRMNAQGGEVEDDDENEGMGRDWLDWVYVLSRMVVLLSVVYFYSTISRFMVVVCLAMLLYLYQAGWFRPARRVDVPPEERNDNNDLLDDPAANQQQDDDRNNNINNNNNNNEVPREVGQAHIVENQGLPEEPEVLANDGAATNRIVGDDELQARQSLLALSWTFLTTFFTSLFPEQPQVI